MSRILDFAEFILDNKEKYLIESDGRIDIDLLYQITLLLEQEQLNFVSIEHQGS